MTKERSGDIELNLKERYLRPQVAEAMYVLRIKPREEDVDGLFNCAKNLLTAIEMGVRPYLSDFVEKMGNGDPYDALRDYREAQNAASFWGIKTTNEIDLIEGEIVFLCWNLFNPRMKMAEIDLAVVLDVNEDFIHIFEAYPLFSLSHMSGSLLPHNHPETYERTYRIPIRENERIIYKANALVNRPKL